MGEASPNASNQDAATEKDGNYPDPCYHSLGRDLEQEILPAYLEHGALSDMRESTDNPLSRF